METPRAAILRASSGEEDTFLWSLADLLTLLLIFFIFLYAQSIGQNHSDAPLSQSSITTSALPIHLPPVIASKMESPIFEHASIRPNMIPPSTDTNSPEDTGSTPSFISYQPAAPEPAPQPQSIEDPGKTAPEESIEGLRRAALTAIDKTEASACSIRWNQNRLVFVLGERFTFPVGEARLLSDFKPTLEQIARLIAAKTDYKVMISGHTDDTPIATEAFPSNWELSAARAISVAKSIIESGVDPHRITIQGHAEFRPVRKNSSPQNKEANRRVEITLFKEENRGQDAEALY